MTTMLHHSDDVIEPTDNLIVQGIPPIPAALRAATERYTEAVQSSYMMWHPFERSMVIKRRVGDGQQLFMVSSPGAEPVQMSTFDDIPELFAYPRRDASRYLVAMAAGGNERYQCYIVDAASGRSRMVTDGESRNITPRFSPSGTSVAFVSNARNGADMDLHVAGAHEGAASRMVTELEGGGWLVGDWSHDEKHLLLEQWISHYEAYLWLVRTDSGERVCITPPGTEMVNCSGACFDVDAGGVYALTDRDSEFMRLVHIDLATGKQRVLSGDIPWDIDSLCPTDDCSRIAMVSNEDGISRMWLYTVATDTLRRIDSIPTGVIAGFGWHENNRDIGFTFLSARTPMDAFSVDADTGELTRWTQTNLPGLEVGTFSEPELIHWHSFDGQRISGFIHRPAEQWTGRRPVIISIHGGPAAQALPLFQGRYNYLLDELGVAIIYPNVRGSSGYGKTFLKMDDGYLREDSHRDVATLFDWIAAQSDLDADRVMVTGGSYGGYMTLAVAVNYPDRIRCAVDVVGISNFVTFLTNTADYRRDLRRVEYGDERIPEMRAFLERISPLTNAESITKPIFIVQGMNDPRVPASEAEQMVARLQAIGTPVWYLAASDEGHGFMRKSNVDFQFFATVKFLEQYLLP